MVLTVALWQVRGLVPASRAGGSGGLSVRWVGWVDHRAGLAAMAGGSVSFEAALRDLARDARSAELKVCSAFRACSETTYNAETAEPAWFDRLTMSAHPELVEGCAFCVERRLSPAFKPCVARRLQPSVTSPALPRNSNQTAPACGWTMAAARANPRPGRRSAHPAARRRPGSSSPLRRAARGSA